MSIILDDFSTSSTDSTVQGVEHIAGPDCTSTNGYSGHRLSLEEMSHCRVWQALVRKPDAPSDFQPSPDDEPFERSENIFLSGISDHMPDTEMGGSAQVHPIRHGVVVPDVTNAIFDSVYTYVNNCSMPFHPWCLEIFKRASHAKMGRDDMAGLWGWYENEADYQMFFEGFPRNGPTIELRQQWWEHAKGSEWIVCNPLFMPTLSDALQTVVSADPSFDPGQGAFDIPDYQISTSAQDPFTALPTELRLMILHDLCSKDVASLRLSSRVFRQLSISLWHHLIQEDFPWFWEASASSLSTYSFWTTTSEEELQATPVSSEDRQPVSVPDSLDPTRTNWHKLYFLLKERENDAEYRSLRGLRNRERIWKDCGEILRRIEGYRERDEIPVLDLAKLVHERTEATRRRNRERREAKRLEQERDQGVVTHTAAAEPL